MRFLSVNLNCVLIEFPSLEETIATYHFLQHHQHPHIQEMIPAARTILVYFNDLFIDAKNLIQWISAQKINQDFFDTGKEVVIEVNYQGADLINVAEHVGISVEEVIYKHTHSHWQVAFIGFAPGFAYLVSSDHPFTSIPRLASPRKKIRAGSVGLAGEYSGVYPKDSPGGWQLIGQTDEKMWDIHRAQPALLLPSDQVIFKDVRHHPIQISVPNLPVSPPKNNEKSAIFEVKSVGLQVLIQDDGRKNMSKLGIGRAGAMDQRAFKSANLIVGNPSDAAVFEILNGGLRLKALQSTVIAVTGAAADLWITYANSDKVQESLYQPIALDAGDEIYIAAPQAGVRNYLAIRGGLAVERVLESASYDVLAELGTPPIQVGDQICAGLLKTQAVNLDQSAIDLPSKGETVVVDVILGPRTDWFNQQSVDMLFNQAWLVTTESNRIGLRLVGEHPLQREINQELPSEGCCTGAIQVPANGQPVLFMNDHPLTGGYPVIAAVAPYHLDLVAQLAAGCFIQFRKISDFMDITSHVHTA
ncbi:urea amidolyase family protein [Acinetobacter haemolyticus]|uniref:5-oxoprolinase subunit B/C family protein n=1 Tax=Acinetobacter haemolyticus TaxID=29430 RepID=UPI000D696D94|nr:urea amidolyase family protein [Acinetobacter haemolyticus]